MPDEKASYHLCLEIRPSDDGRWVTWQTTGHIPGQKQPITGSNTISSDALHLQLAGEVENALRSLTNHIVTTIIKPQQVKRRMNQ